MQDAQSSLDTAVEGEQTATEGGTISMQHGISRRMLIKAAGLGAGAFALGSSLLAGPAVEAATFYKGADISWLPQMEAHGYKFYNASGVQQDVLTILKGYGINAIRLRTWVVPSSDPVKGHCSQAETVAMAVRCKKAGLPVDIDFHFSDSWADEGKQHPPASWANMSYSNMLNALQHYTWNVMNDLKTNGVTPAWVQIGNEINQGLCLPTGSMSLHPTQATGLLNGAYAMVKQVFPSTPVLIHLASPHKTANIEWFLDTYKRYGGKWDMTAFSSYLTGSAISGAISNMATFKSRYGKPVMQVEAGSIEKNPTQANANITAYLKGVKGFGGLGVFYWEPEVYSPFTNYAMGAWDPSTKRPTIALDAFRSV